MGIKVFVIFVKNQLTLSTGFSEFRSLFPVQLVQCQFHAWVGVLLILPLADPSSHSDSVCIPLQPKLHPETTNRSINDHLNLKPCPAFLSRMELCETLLSPHWSHQRQRHSRGGYCSAPQMQMSGSSLRNLLEKRKMWNMKWILGIGTSWAIWRKSPSILLTASKHGISGRYSLSSLYQMDKFL